MIPFKYTIGDKKLGRDTLIFNMGPATGCPSQALGLCQIPAGRCCAQRPERQYPACLPYRKAQKKYWLLTTAAETAADINAALARHKKIKYIRFNEAGDFTTQKCINKLLNVAAQVPDVIFYGYTARRDLTIPEIRPRNVVINGSGFMIDNNFSYENKKARYTCAGDCRTCSLCKEPGRRIINDPKH